jgi:hypothetical protein
MSRRNEVSIGHSRLAGFLAVPEAAKGSVIFAHGSGSSRFSPRNRYAADYLERRGFATLLFDLLTESEADDRRNVFDIALLGARVVKAVDWARCDAQIFLLPIGLFGASSAAMMLREQVDEVVCLRTPENFDGVGAFYRDFHQLSDSEVADLLAKHASTAAVSPGDAKCGFAEK